MSVQSQHIAVLMGGWSPERDVSLVSGRAIGAALRRLGFTVSEIDSNVDLALQLDTLQPDLCFNALHGVGGEDGTVQGLLEVMRLRYTHSGVLASAVAMDKVQAKRIFSASGLPIAPHVVIAEGVGARDHPLPPPYVVKPINQGSSFGVILVGTGEPLPNTMGAGEWDFSGDALVEDYIPGRELTCAVLGERALEVMEIIPRSGFYDFHTKYTDGAAQHTVPADISTQLSDEIKAITLCAHEALGCRTVSRADFRYDSDASRLALLEINTQPGMTPQSLVPELAAFAGLSFDELVCFIVEDAA